MLKEIFIYIVIYIMGNMTMDKIIELLQSGLKRKIETKI